MKAERQSALGQAGPHAAGQVGGLTGWLLARLGGAGRARPRLKLVERITLAPRQSLALVEAEGRRFLVATSQEGAPAFFSLDESGPKAIPVRTSPARTSPARHSPLPAVHLGARVSW